MRTAHVEHRRPRGGNRGSERRQQSPRNGGQREHAGSKPENAGGQSGEPWNVIQLLMAGVVPINFWLARNKTLRSGGQPLSSAAGDHNLFFEKE